MFMLEKIEDGRWNLEEGWFLTCSIRRFMYLSCNTTSKLD